MCSTVHSDSIPASSAAWAIPIAPSENAIGPTLANITPNFIVAPRSVGRGTVASDTSLTRRMCPE